MPKDGDECAPPFEVLQPISVTPSHWLPNDYAQSICSEYKGSRNSVEGGWKWGEHKLPKVSSYTYLGIDFACNGVWKWGEHKLPKVSSCTYLGIDFACNGACDVHLRVLDNGRERVNQLRSIISNRDTNLSARRL